MSLARAFTTRRKEPEISISAPMFIGRAASQRGGRPVARSKISSPIALVSTSNTLLNRARTIIGTSPIDMRSTSYGSSSSSVSGEDSDASTASIHSRDTVTDASSVDESPVSAAPEPNHLSCYFKPAVDTANNSPVQSPTAFDAPRVPQRVPSHSKKAHESLHRKRSIQRIMSPPPSRGHDIDREQLRSPAETFFSSSRSGVVEAPKESPFGKELAQLDEVAEELGQVVCQAETDADSGFMQAYGLAAFTASDYLSEIQSLIYDTFADELVATHEIGSWI